MKDYKIVTTWNVKTIITMLQVNTWELCEKCWIKIDMLKTEIIWYKEYRLMIAIFKYTESNLGIEKGGLKLSKTLGENVEEFVL